ncbi:MAG: Hsp33 family molecular chaperone HslO [Christensenellaceae bacterium]|nr:Hsp33 family molecular chaperone HslO [Christensenellaceae bacterium]
MKNILSRYLLNNDIVISASDTTELAEYAHQIHETYPTATAALGRTLTAAVMMASGLKGKDQNLTISINGGGPAGTVLATADANGRVKGCINNPFVDLPAKEDGSLDVGGAIGKDGFVTVSKNVGAPEPYVGRTPLVSGEIAEDLAYYYLQSEQQPTVVYLCTWVDIDTRVIAAGGLVIAPLPGASEESLKMVEERLHLINNYALMLMNLSPDEAVRKIFKGLDLKHLGDSELSYCCDCSRERLEQVLISLGEAELKDIIEKDHGAELTCRFCNKKYQFSENELNRLLLEAKS